MIAAMRRVKDRPRDCRVCGARFTPISYNSRQKAFYPRRNGVVTCGPSCKSQRARIDNSDHGGTGTRLFVIWQLMKRRCHDVRCRQFKWYGAKGIKVCSSWLAFPQFRDWALSNGYRDDLTIDRIDNSGDYGPQNCRWTSLSRQQRNRSNVVLDEATVSVIKRRLRSGESHKSIASSYDVTAGNIDHIAAGKIWRDVA